MVSQERDVWLGVGPVLIPVLALYDGRLQSTVLSEKFRFAIKSPLPEKDVLYDCLDFNNAESRGVATGFGYPVERTFLLRVYLRDGF